MLYFDMIYSLELIDHFCYHNLVIKFEHQFLENTINMQTVFWNNNL